jgi:Holliday junction resolvase
VEAKLQLEIRKYLKSKGCYVLKTRPDARGSSPTGCPDIIFLKEGFWGALEVKASAKAKWQPLQKETVAKLDDWSWARRVDPDNWTQIRSELDSIL